MTIACICGHAKGDHGADAGWCMHLENSNECPCFKYVRRTEQPTCLAGIMEDQRELQIRIKRNLGESWPKTKAEMNNCVKFTAVAIADEAFELLHTTHWKHWRKGKFDLVEAKKELIDVLTFCLNGFNDLGMSANEVTDLFYAKHTINKYRQDKLEEGDPL